MTVTQHEIMLKAESRSKAKIMRKQLKSYMVGHKFEVFFELTNVGSTVFPGGTFSVIIVWPNGQIVQTPKYQIPKLGTGNTYKTTPFTTDAISRGYGLFSISMWGSKDGRDLRFRDASGKSFGNSFHAILAKEPEEIYEFWGMIIAAASLAFLVGIELIRFLIWLGTILN